MNSLNGEIGVGGEILWDNGRSFWNANSGERGREELRRNYDGWLEANGVLAATNGGVLRGDALELGAGSGVDALHLVELGFRATACDFAPNAVENLRRNVPECVAVEVDLSREFPFADAGFDLVVANKSLHYFSERRTFELFAEIWRVMRVGGVFAFVVNSLSEYRGDGRQVEKNYYEFGEGNPRVHSPNKRFFDEPSLRYFLTEKPWQILSLKLQIERSSRLQILHPNLREKSTYLCVCRKSKS